MTDETHGSDAEDRAQHSSDGNGVGLRHIAVVVALSAFCFAFVFMLIRGPAVVFWYVPKVPKDPGWSWCLGMASFNMLSIVVLMPIWVPMCTAAGLLFGFVKGALMNFVSIFGAAVLSFCIGRLFLRKTVRGWIEGSNPRIHRMMSVMEEEEDAMKTLIFFRFLLIPMMVRNYGPSTLRVPLWKLCVASIPHDIWAAIVFASLGSTFKDAVRKGRKLDFHSIHWQHGVAFVAAASVSVYMAFYARSKYIGRLAIESEATSLIAPADREKGARGGEYQTSSQQS
eukprot:CAMPEP_0117517532 /NCGR_PEP_ID=MMETSP0784-20121206/31660_1 /TAXON_ID=39447 /ORGANISM="" /LENGTH=282 /DNA_ID=CAMNT_0005313415 /DNA_START=99 /DNA_END=947 /DNA_ORIENTATION=-